MHRPSRMNQEYEKKTEKIPDVRRTMLTIIHQLPWSDLPLEILHSYRHVHKLPTPSAFASDYSRIVLSQGVGLRSPTSLAARRAQNSTSGDSPRRGQDRVSKDQFALVVRRHFNSAGLSEQETIARFLYTVREERRGRQFRLRFQS